jgi:predicted nucleic acid-binding protein
MSKRLQVILKDPEYREIQRVARSRHMSIAEWVPQALDLARRGEPRRAVERAKPIVLGYRQLSARDAVHLSVMEQHGIHQIVSFDSGFDAFPGIARLS